MSDYSKFFSDDVPFFLGSPVREIFRAVDLSSIYSFAGGYPDAATFPVEEIERLTTLVLEKYGSKALQYSGTQGVGCHCLLPHLFTSLPKSLTSSHLWDANDHPPLHRG